MFDATNCDVDAQLTAGKTYSLTISNSPPAFTLEHDAGTWSQTADGSGDLACEGESSGGYEIKSPANFSRFVTFLNEPDLFLLGNCSGDLQ